MLLLSRATPFLGSLKKHFEVYNVNTKQVKVSSIRLHAYAQGNKPEYNYKDKAEEAERST